MHRKIKRTINVRINTDQRVKSFEYKKTEYPIDEIKNLSDIDPFIYAFKSMFKMGFQGDTRPTIGTSYSGIKSYWQRFYDWNGKKPLSANVGMFKIHIQVTRFHQKITGDLTFSCVISMQKKESIRLRNAILSNKDKKSKGFEIPEESILVDESIKAQSVKLYHLLDGNTKTLAKLERVFKSDKFEIFDFVISTKVMQITLRPNNNTIYKMGEKGRGGRFQKKYEFIRTKDFHQFLKNALSVIEKSFNAFA